MKSKKNGSTKKIELE